MLVLIIIRGGTVYMSNSHKPDGNNLTDFGGLLFFTFAEGSASESMPTGAKKFMPYASAR